MKIAPEGKPLIAAAALVSFLLFLRSRAGGLIAATVMLFITFFFRDPERDVIEDDRKVTSAADGQVVSIEEVDEPEYIGGRALKIAVFMSIMSVHVNRAPLPGRVEFVKHVPGKFLPAFHENASFENERNLLGLATPRGKVLVKQIAGVVARRVVCRVAVGDTLAQGERFGMIKFSSRCEIFLEKNEALRLNVNIMDEVRGGLTVLAEYAE